MAIPLVTTSEPLNKGRFPVFFLTSSSFTGYNIGPGRNIPYLDTADEFQDVLFLTCKNYKKREKGMICASSDAKFENLPPDEHFPCSLILMQGVFFCNEEKSFKFAFYKWKGPSSELDSISCVIKSYGCCRRFVRDMFDPQLLTSPVDLMHLRYLNQITGPSLPGWDVNIKVVRTPRGEFYESGEAPDSWLNSYHCPLTLRRKLLSVTPSEMHPKCFLPLRRNREMKNFEIPSTTQWKNSTLKLLLCKKSDEGLNTGRFLLQPVPTGEPSVQLFALITRNQLSELNELLLQCHPTCWMTWEAFTSKMRSYTNANGIEDFIRLNTFQASVTCPVVVSVVDNFAQQGGSYLSPSVKEEVLKRNILDWEIPGVVLFRGYAWSYEPSIDNIHINFLEKVYFGNGLTRSRCDHVGSFTMNGRRQSNMASASIGQAPGRARMHMYWDPKKMNPSLLPLGQNIINLISNEATNVQDHCGGVIIGLQVKAMKTYLPENEQLHSHGICPYKILTTSCFANTMHVDNDKMSKDDTCLVNKLVQEKGSEHVSAFEYLCRMRQLYPFTNTRLPLPTTCCWSSVFDSTTKQVGATFSGSLFHHLTSLPLWTDGNMVTTICQRRMYNFAWGSSGGPAEKNK